MNIVYPDGCDPNFIGIVANVDAFGNATAILNGPGESLSTLRVTSGYALIYFTDGNCDYAQPIYFDENTGGPAPSVTGEGCLPAEAVTASAPIPAWVQAYGRTADAACADGWDASWQEWAAPVTGGWVCTRSIPSLG